jgi:hypothetical protein
MVRHAVCVHTFLVVRVAHSDPQAVATSDREGHRRVASVPRDAELEGALAGKGKGKGTSAAAAAAASSGRGAKATFHFFGPAPVDEARRAPDVVF